MISSFNLDPQAIMNLLFETKSVISGSLVLLVFFPQLFTPGDINFYVPIGSGGYFMARIANISDYLPVLSCSQGYNSVGCLDSVFSMISNSSGKKINIIVSAMPSAIHPILKFHSTTVMNIISCEYLKKKFC